MPTNDDVATISWWFLPENVKAREELEANRPELAQWLRKVEEAVEARMGSFMMNFKSGINGNKGSI